jgi:uncharacterized protein YndB with AHSA1/START domain
MAPVYQLSLQRTIEAPSWAVYRAWTEPDLLPQWFAPHPVRVVRAELDVRPGGSNLIVMRMPDGADIVCRGVYLEVVPGRRLVMTDAYTSAWIPSEKPFMTADIRFEELAPGRTLYSATVYHWSEADRIAHEHMGFHQGWGQCADQLMALAPQVAAASEP